MQILETSFCKTKTVLVGKNSRGQWVALEQSGLFGGVFVTRADAVRYALFENDRHPEALVMISGVLELDIDQARSAAETSVDVAQRLVA